MKKMIIRCRPRSEMIGSYQGVLDKLESFELLDLLKIDFEKGEKMGLIEIELKEGLKLEDLDFPASYEILSVLKQEGQRYVLLGKVKSPKEMMPLFRKLDLDLVWTAPMKRTRDEMVMGVIGSEENLRILLDVLPEVCDIVDVGFQNPTVDSYDSLSCLTPRQKEILTAARENGYYDHPRKINAEELAGLIGISKATTLEHLRKAESRLMGAIFSGH